MSPRRAAILAFLTALLPARALAAPFQPAAAQPSPIGRFDLITTPDGHERAVPAGQIDAGLASPGYRPLPGGGAILSLDAVASTNYHTTYPRVALREALRWRPADGGAVYEGVMRLDKLPRGGILSLAGLDATPGQNGRTPRLRLLLDGDRILIATTHEDAVPFTVTGGAVGPSRMVSYRIAVMPSGRTEVTINGTHSVMMLPPEALLSFWSGVAVEGDIGHHPDPAQITLAHLSATHSRSQS